MQHVDLHYAINQYSIDHSHECGHFVAVAFRSYCKVLTAGQPDALGNRTIPASAELGLRGVRKAREPGSRPKRQSGSRIASRDVCSIRGVRDQLEPLGGLIVQPVSGNSPKPSTKSRHWCTTCGEDIPAPGFGEGRAHTHCSIECLEWDLEDARRSRDGRLNKLYAMRTKWRRRLGGLYPIRGIV